MTRIAYPYPTLFPKIQKPCQWSATVDDGDERNFQNGVGTWDYNSKLKLIINKSWNIEKFTDNRFTEIKLSESASPITENEIYELNDLNHIIKFRKP